MPENQICKLFENSQETEEPQHAKIEGSIPEWIFGTFLRTGPAKWDLDNGQFSFNHLLDGFAMISKFVIDSSVQTVTLEKKFLNSDAYSRAIAAKRPVVTEFGTPSCPDPNRSWFSKILSAFLPIELSDNNSSALFRLGSEVFTTSETCFFRSLDPVTLTSHEKHDTNKCFGVNIDSGHPLTDDDGTTWNMGSTFLMGLKYNLYKIPAQSSCACAAQSAKELMNTSKIVATIPSSWNGLMSYNHQSFILTTNYVVFIEQPFVMNIGKAAKSILRGSPTFSQYVEWRPELRNRFFVIEKESGNVLKNEIYAAESFFFLHYVNAYEENNQIVLDLISYKNAELFDDMYMDKLRSGNIAEVNSGSAHRYVIPLREIDTMDENRNLVEVKSEAQVVRSGSTLIVYPEVLTFPGIEYPVLNKSRAGRKYKYFYGTGTLVNSPYTNSITKFDLSAKIGGSLSWTGSEAQYPGEPQLLPNPAGRAEDDAVLISAVTDVGSNVNDFLLFLDARSMTEIGRAHFSHKLPQAVHGLFLPADA